MHDYSVFCFLAPGLSSSPVTVVKRSFLTVVLPGGRVVVEVFVGVSSSTDGVPGGGVICASVWASVRLVSGDDGPSPGAGKPVGGSSITFSKMNVGGPFTGGVA